MDTFRAIMITDGDKETDEELIRAAWQYLHDTGLADRLGGHFRKERDALLISGFITDRSPRH